METKIKNLLARLAFFADEGMADAPIVAIAKDADALLKEMCRGFPEQAQQAEPVEPGLYAILYRDNWDGEGDVYHLLAEYKDGKWLNDVSGKELLQYEGDAILRVWPLTDDKAQPPAVAEGCGACGDGCKGQGCRLERESPPTCQTCNGQGMVGGLLPNGGGYDGQPCPDCTAPHATAEDSSVVGDDVAVPEPHPYAGKRKGHPDGDFSYRCGSDYCRCAQ